MHSLLEASEKQSFYYILNYLIKQKSYLKGVPFNVKKRVLVEIIHLNRK